MKNFESKYKSIENQGKYSEGINRLKSDLASKTGGNVAGFRAYLRNLGYKTFTEDKGKIVCWEKRPFMDGVIKCL